MSHSLAPAVGGSLFSRSITVFAVIGLVMILAPTLVTPAGAASPDVVISQLYGGGGNSGATLPNDYVELLNTSGSPVSVAGWSVQYASATGNTWNVTNLPAVSIPAGGYFLVQQAAGACASGCSVPPPPDASGNAAMSATAGKVALVTNQTGLTCGGAVGNCFPNSVIRDLVGYGTTADNFEATRAPAPSNTTANLRLSGGCLDTDANAADFVTGTPAPRNASSPANACRGGTPTPASTPTSALTPTGVTATPTITLTPVITTRIRDIQGTGHLSPLNGTSVTNVPGVVTALRTNGFYMQDPLPVGNNATSEGIFVFTSSNPSAVVAAGDSILVTGNVTEFRPGGSNGTNNLTLTEIVSPVVAKLSSGNALPTPVVIGLGGRVSPTQVIDDDATGNVETSGTFDFASDGIDFYESMESMLVRVNNAVVVGPTNAFDEILVLADSGSGAGLRTARGGVVVQPNDFKPERIMLDGVMVTTPKVNVGDTFTGPVVGVLDYDFSNFKIQITSSLTAVSGGLGRETTAAAGPNQLAVATFNVENLDPSDPPAQFSGLATLIVTNLQSPDLIAIEEVQDNNGATNNGVVDATTTYTALIAAIQTAGGPTYQFRQIDPVNNQDGGEPGGNIRVGFLFRTDRGLSFVDRPGGTSTLATGVVSGPGGPELLYSPGRIDPTNAAFTNSRKPLAGEFTFNGHKIFAIANHFNSKGGDQPLFGRFQPPTFPSEVQRNQQAQVVNDFVDAILAADANAKIVVLGDINDFQFSSTVATLKGGVLATLIDTLPASERYSYVFEGNSQTLDHILVSNVLLPVATYDVVHVNSEFWDQLSDHDPSVARLTLPPTTPTATPTATATLSPTPSSTTTFTLTPTNSSTLTPTPTNTATFTLTPTRTPSATATPFQTPTVTRVLVAAAADTYVRQSAQDTNEGASTFLRVRNAGNNRALVRFDTSAIQSALAGRTLVSAHLELAIVENGRNWGQSGRPVDAHRMIVSWVEGNGFVDDSSDSERGMGAGATWACAIDANIADHNADCGGTTEWEMGRPNRPDLHPWLIARTARATITNDSSGIIAWDVTADVATFLSGATANNGWIVSRTDEAQNGLVSFGSRESASGPRLVLLVR